MRRKLIENNKSFDAVGYMLMNLADSSEPSEEQQFNNDESDYEALHIFQDKTPEKDYYIFVTLELEEKKNKGCKVNYVAKVLEV